MDEGEPRRGGGGSGPGDGTEDRLVAAVHAALAAETYERFDDRVAEQAAQVAADCEAGRLDNADYAVGLELEAYTVDPQARLHDVPAGAPEAGGFAPELGRHNLEVNTPPDVLSPAGLDRQAERLDTAVTDAREAIAEAGAAAGVDGRVRPVLDSMWTVAPPEGTSAYLSAGEARDGVWIAENMATDARYHALDADTLRRMDNGIPIDLPGAEHHFPSILVESLATSVQPHLQLPAAADVGRYMRYATRILGPAVALTANSPFLPADLYPEAVDAEAVLDGPHELRVPVYEDSINPPGIEKVRVPDDVADASEAVDAIVADETFAPFCTDPEDVPDDAPYRERFPEFAHKHGTYWRWVRPVFGGDTPAAADGRADGNDDASVRLEFRPVPTQPTVRDCIAVQAMVAGALRGLDELDHPLRELPWAAARDSFYNAVADGPGADLAWITEDGDRTDNPDIALAELLSVARVGLSAAGFPEDEIDRWIGPLEARQVTAITPSVWKKHRVRAGMDHGETFHEAVEAMQWEYIELSEATDSFTEWL
ncbi:hypothetical protein [Haloglomus halophilum]|uniref:hypothetical protein n=1 Tax=Haloglomus halophilum TaxID=2962672 RepID=UPI0020CA2603|nr:hypothetical protein [Haloglomus halophilum]